MSTPLIDQSIEQLCINTIRTLSMDAVQAANSGHPGTPMALAPVGYSLWNGSATIRNRPFGRFGIVLYSVVAMLQCCSTR